MNGTECIVSANDPTVRGGASNPFTMRKSLRCADIALENRLPSVSLVESGGADLPTQAEIFIPGGRMFRDLTRRSAAAIPTIALVFGNSTAGGAYIPGMCDYIVMIEKRSKVFLGGPPLVKMATGESLRRRGARRRIDARPGVGARRLPGDRRDRTRSVSDATSSAGSTGTSTARARRCPPTTRSSIPEELLGSACSRLEDRVRPARGDRQGCGRLAVRRVQAPLRPEPRDRLGVDPRLSDRHPRQPPRDPLQRGGRTRRPSSSSWPTRWTLRFCSSRTPPATWSERTTSSAGSSRTAPR